MATSGELRAIVDELELIDIGDAESYLEDDDGERRGETGWEIPGLSATLEEIFFPGRRKSWE